MAHCVTPRCSEVPSRGRFSMGGTKRGAVPGWVPRLVRYYGAPTPSSVECSAFSGLSKVPNAGKRGRSHPTVPFTGLSRDRQELTAVRGGEDRGCLVQTAENRGFRCAHSFPRPTRYSPATPGGKAQAVRRLQLTTATVSGYRFFAIAFLDAANCPSAWERPKKFSGGPR